MVWCDRWSRRIQCRSSGKVDGKCLPPWAYRPYTAANSMALIGLQETSMNARGAGYCITPYRRASFGRLSTRPSHQATRLDIRPHARIAACDRGLTEHRAGLVSRNLSPGGKMRRRTLRTTLAALLMCCACRRVFAGQSRRCRTRSLGSTAPIIPCGRPRLNQFLA